MNKKMIKMMPMASCKEASRLISEGMNRKLSFKENLGLRMHLMMCDNCREVIKQLKGLRRLMQSYRQYLTTKKTHIRLLSQSFKDKLKQQLTD